MTLGLLGDLRHAARVLLRTPGVTAAAILSVALGVGANATLFSWTRAVLLAPLPGVPDGGKLVTVAGTDPREGSISLSYPHYLELRQAKAFSGLLAHEEVSVALESEGRSERAWGLLVSENYFDVLQVKPQLGRGFLPAEGRSPGAGPVVVLGDELWRRRFGADPAVVGRTVQLNRQPFTVVGVAPPGFIGSVVGLRLDLFVPIVMADQLMGTTRLDEEGHRWFVALGRLAPGATIAQARTELTTINTRLVPGSDIGIGVDSAWAAQHGAGRVLGPVLKMLTALAVLVLGIACANVAGLLLGRAATRRRELAVRHSLGASRWRLVRQLLTESLLLAFLSGVAGVAVAYWGAGSLQWFVPPSDLPVYLAPTVDTPVLVFSLLAATLCGLGFGLVPALQATREETNSALRSESLTATAGTGRARLRSMLVIGQVAVSLLLLVCAGLLLRSLRAAQDIDPGFRSDGVLLASVDLQAGGLDKAAGLRLLRDGVERLGALPAVEVASLTRRAPLGMGGRSSSSIGVPGWTSPDGKPAWAQTHAGGPDFVRALGATLVSGRDFSAADTADSPPVALVDGTMARLYWGDADPVGREINYLGRTTTVVGVIRTFKQRALNEEPVPNLFVPLQQAYQPRVTFMVRGSSVDAEALAPAVMQVLRELDASLPVFEVRTLAEHVQAATVIQRMAGTLLSIFGALALVLAVVGLYGVLAHGVAQRVREIGVRRALGCTDGHVVRLVLGQTGALVGVGLGAGIGAAVGVAPLLRKLLLGIGPHDPWTFAVVAALLLASAALAAGVPTLRALRIRPSEALRSE